MLFEKLHTGNKVSSMSIDPARIVGASSQLIIDIAERYGHEPAANIEQRLNSAIRAAGFEPSSHVREIAARIAAGARGSDIFA